MVELSKVKHRDIFDIVKDLHEATSPGPWGTGKSLTKNTGDSISFYSSKNPICCRTDSESSVSISGQEDLDSVRVLATFNHHFPHDADFDFIVAAKNTFSELYQKHKRLKFLMKLTLSTLIVVFICCMISSFY